MYILNKLYKISSLFFFHSNNDLGPYKYKTCTKETEDGFVLPCPSSEAKSNLIAVLCFIIVQYEDNTSCKE